MCGIAGSTKDPEGRDVRAMCGTLRHRGPDDEGIHTDAAGGVSIGARRLAVMDIPGGHPPLCNADGTVWAAFNGEIYNHPPRREDLRRRGHTFQTHGDTEVLVHLYEEYGEAMVHALEGMFAFAIWDQRARRLLLARDRFGEKPLFLHERDGELLFASELTSLLEVRPALRELDPAAIDAFFVFAYVPGPGTVVPGVRQLPPGRLLSWERGRGCGEQNWWSPPELPVPRRDDLRSLTADARAAEESSTLLRTFTVGYDVGSVNETERARIVAQRLGSEHHEVTLTQEDVAERAPLVLSRMDQPLGDRAALPLHAVSQFARPRVTV